MNGDPSSVRVLVQFRNVHFKGYLASNKNEGWSNLAPPAFSDLIYRLLTFVLILNWKPSAYSGIPRLPLNERAYARVMFDNSQDSVQILSFRHVVCRQEM